MMIKKLFKSTTACILILAFLAFLPSCSDNSGEVSVAEDVCEELLSVDEAKQLLSADAELTDIFVSCSLASKKTSPEYYPAEGSKFYFFKSIQSLCEKTYSESGGEYEFFLSYPLADIPAVKDVEGVTYAFPHKGSKVYDRAVIDSVTVEGNGEPGVAIIKADTEKGSSVSLKAVKEDGVWLLEKSVFNSLPVQDDEYKINLPYSGVGSFGSFCGKILVVEFFVYDKNDTFTEAEESAFSAKVESTFSLLSEASKAYTASVEIDYEKIYFESSVTFNARPIEFDIMMSETGFGSLQSFIAENFDTSSYDNYCVAVCMNKKGYYSDTFQCRYENTEETEFYYAERLFVTPESTVPDMVISALNLLGADEEALNTETYRVYFPDDIFVTKDISSAISPVIAYASGMTHKLSPLYRIFISDD